MSSQDLNVAAANEITEWLGDMNEYDRDSILDMMLGWIPGKHYVVNNIPVIYMGDEDGTVFFEAVEQ